MRVSPILGILFALGGLTLTVHAAAPTPVDSTTTTTVHVDIAPKDGAKIQNKMNVGDKCTITIKQGTNGAAMVTVKDTTANPTTKVTGTLETADAPALMNADLGFPNVTWTLAGAGKNGVDFITLTTTDKLPSKN